MVVPARHAAANPSLSPDEQAPDLSARHTPGDEITPGGSMVLPVGCHQVVKDITLFLLALFVQARCFSPALVGRHERRPSVWLPGAIMQEPVQEMGVVCWRSTVPSRKHEEAQTRTIGGARRLFIHQTYVVDERRCHAAHGLHVHGGASKEGDK